MHCDHCYDGDRHCMCCGGGRGVRSSLGKMRCRARLGYVMVKWGKRRQRSPHKALSNKGLWGWGITINQEWEPGDMKLK